MKAPLEGWLDGCSCSYGKGSVGARTLCARVVLRQRKPLRARPYSRHSVACRGGAPYASMGTRALRVDMESAPTSAESFGPGGGKRKPQINQLSATATRYL